MWELGWNVEVFALHDDTHQRVYTKELALNYYLDGIAGKEKPASLYLQLSYTGTMVLLWSSLSVRDWDVD